MSDALKRLIEAVEVGDRPHELAHEVFGDTMEFGMVMCALNPKLPDLNAAKYLHDALLPGWNYLVSKNDGEVWHDGIYHESIIAHVDGNPARAWLLAILRAYQQVQQ